MTDLDLIENADHAHSCPLRTTSCLCEYEGRATDELTRLRAELAKVNARLEQVWGDAELALAHFDVGETDIGKDVLQSAVEGEAPIAITRLRAENARLREAGQAVVDSHPMTRSFQIEDLRAALKEGGGE